ncbi:HAMP domain-containing protein [Campylobacter sputorum subsp. bubulus]|uniref:histidine kinase n=1 Tax=Campylobacter sputorum subsp. sputorum TaxID=32024 RepID=A0A381DLP7_9BACT|nr:ArsS family sensor histidine kinase [Campylobacter sputorum]ASM34830.1 two-component system sensor histidine kinase [Campylobacter sputorum aubsp. sputorum RM3237]KAB0581614.1 HAMP domain-containing histidine kinase [Campylobacter sputorum subsp. sputorum]QEL05023.1 two-component system sensor histidine kinase [Campylobacter sputorum subsp. sputorum]SUX10203.1 HAMP domain-containing protein [Campylobacter sputorum subsp. bubulus]SUX11510.1 HAMP domain-containing protein [Campylobacter sputo
MIRSISTKITIIFCIAFSVVCLLFLTFSDMQKNIFIEKTKDRQISAINYLTVLYSRGNVPDDFGAYFKNFGLKYVDDKKLNDSILNSKTQLFVVPTELGVFESISYGDNLYLYLKNPSFNILLQNIDDDKISDSLWIGFILSATLLISLYISVMKNLAPLKKLNRNIKNFATGNLDIVCFESNSNDEIAELGREFGKAVIKIRELIRSRQLFLRAIMHELKTPIGKGRIVCELLDDEVQKKRLSNIFERLEMLINEFAKVEQLLSKSYSFNYSKYHISEIVDQALDILMLDNFENKININTKQNPILKADFQLLSLAIKNLLDNSLKYSKNGKSELYYDENMLSVKNLGDPLDNTFDYYKQAFIREKDSKVSGMGLGLYIVDHICQMHKFKFDYRYKDGYHEFIIWFSKEASSEKRA